MPPALEIVTECACANDPQAVPFQTSSTSMTVLIEEKWRFGKLKVEIPFLLRSRAADDRREDRYQLVGFLFNRCRERAINAAFFS